ncbi:hypothetical protein HY639_03680 [Candidatus Woesearchaeota archaeon]|nr:hypothetical protein [Candidatus Woesearchaeota archaeon]
MTSGKEVHDEIKKSIRTVEKQHDELSRKVYDAEQRIGSFAAQRENTYNKLATVYLPEMTATSVRQTLHEVQTAVQHLFDEKQAKRRELETVMLDTRKEKQALEEKLEIVDGLLEQKGAERDAIKAKMADELNADKAYTELHELAAKANEQVVQNRKRLETFTEDADKKLVAYQQNPLFMYLVGRACGTPEHAGIPLTKRLDKWVARLINYPIAKQNYDFLLHMPSAIAEEVQRRQAALEGIVGKIRAMEQTVAEKQGLPPVLSEGERLRNERSRILSHIETATAAYHAYATERGKLDDTKDDYHQKAVSQLKDFLKGNTLSELKQRARATRTLEDDNLVTTLEETEQKIRAGKTMIKGLKAEQQELAEKLAGLNKIESKYRNKEFEGSRSYFDSDFDIKSLLTGYLAGKQDVHQVVKKIEDNHHFKRQSSSYSSSSSWGSSSSSSWGSSSSSNSSSWSSGGGFSGGGSSTGGGFSGGGFSTGGGF